MENKIFTFQSQTGMSRLFLESQTLQGGVEGGEKKNFDNCVSIQTIDTNI